LNAKGLPSKYIIVSRGNIRYIVKLVREFGRYPLELGEFTEEV
jgi:hypothetical protein